jgi:hypothetical protein
MMEEDDDINLPGGEIFQPTVLVTRSNATVYPDLGTHSFTEEEKIYFCAMVRHVVGCETDEKTSHSEFCRRYELNRNTTKDWLKLYDSGREFHSTRGCPSALNYTVTAVVISELQKNKSLQVTSQNKAKKDNTKRKHVNDVAATEKLLNEAYIHSQIARKRSKINQQMDNKTMKVLKKRLNARLKLGNMV